jgi:hypothetical protein
VHVTDGLRSEISVGGKFSRLSDRPDRKTLGIFVIRGDPKEHYHGCSQVNHDTSSSQLCAPRSTPFALELPMCTFAKDFCGNKRRIRSCSCFIFDQAIHSGGFGRIISYSIHHLRCPFGEIRGTNLRCDENATSSFQASHSSQAPTGQASEHALGRLWACELMFPSVSF